MKAKKLRDRFQDEMRYRNYSPRTIKSYTSMLLQLSLHFKASPDHLTNEQVKEYALYLKDEKHMAVSSINQLISAWKMLRVDVLGCKPEEIEIKRPRKAKRLPTILSQEEVSRLINALPNLKHYTLLHLAYATGLRRSEILDLKLTDIDSSRHIIRVVAGKGNKSREVPLSDSLLNLLRKYYRQYHPKVYLFESFREGIPYSAVSILNVVKHAAKEAGITKTVYPHILRHSFATHMLERGVNLKRLQMMMGHMSMKTTSIYLHLAHPAPGTIPDLLIPFEEAS